MKIICIGDSITYGQNVASNEAWPAVLAMLTGHDVRNEGVCGDTTRLALERFPKTVQLHNPDMVVIQFGHNDCNFWESDPQGIARVSKSSYAANVKEMVTRTLAIGAIPCILLPHDAPHRDEPYKIRLDLYRQAISRFVPPSLVLQPPKPDLLNDGYRIHPTPAMHQKYAQKVAKQCP
jgi:lysophospholipase L1-like esterase